MHELCTHGMICITFCYNNTQQEGNAVPDHMVTFPKSTKVTRQAKATVQQRKQRCVCVYALVVVSLAQPVMYLHTSVNFTGALDGNFCMSGRERSVRGPPWTPDNGWMLLESLKCGMKRPRGLTAQVVGLEREEAPSSDGTNKTQEGGGKAGNV